jgi:hypothetical protein
MLDQDLEAFVLEQELDLGHRQPVHLRCPRDPDTRTQHLCQPLPAPARADHVLARASWPRHP